MIGDISAKGRLWDSCVNTKAGCWYSKIFNFIAAPEDNLYHITLTQGIALVSYHDKKFLIGSAERVECYYNILLG